MKWSFDRQDESDTMIFGEHMMRTRRHTWCETLFCHWIQRLNICSEDYNPGCVTFSGQATSELVEMKRVSEEGRATLAVGDFSTWALRTLMRAQSLHPV